MTSTHVVANNARLGADGRAPGERQELPRRGGERRVGGGGRIVVEAVAGFGYNNINGEEVFDFAGNFSRVSSRS
jgi:hypothetical protein